HMAFKGTERRDARAIAEEIESAGGEINAATGMETTTYYAKVLKGDWPLALDILADIFSHSILDPGELERERDVILQEIAAANDQPDDLVFDLAQAACYGGHPLGRSILGTADLIASVSREQMVASILSKKLAAGSTHLLIDVPVGPSAKIANAADAMRMRKLFEFVGDRVGLKVEVVTTDWDPFLKNGAGTALGLLGDREAPGRVAACAKGATSILARGHACRILGMIGNRDSARLLLRFAADRKETGYLRMFAVTGLGILGERKDVPLLRGIAFDLDAEIRNDPLDTLAGFM
ncbi:MAG: insulinase family protein, partial [Candidatus Brocadiae bacterium]|nr:insulinase family protein [Candidatus Brocadiia bacterium]